MKDLTPEQISPPFFETESGVLYNLPRDHAHHAGPNWRCAEYQESIYFTAFGKDTKTGGNYSLFFCPTINGYTGGDGKYGGRPWWTALFAVVNLDTGAFQQCVSGIAGPLTSKGSGPDVDPKKFWYDYNIDGRSIDGSFIRTAYNAAEEKWTWECEVTQPKKGDAAYSLKVDGLVKAPGYFTPEVKGLTLEGAPAGGPDQHTANSLTGYGLSYYINVANMHMKGPVKCGDVDIEFEGNAWSEHQFGRYVYLDKVT